MSPPGHPFRGVGPQASPGDLSFKILQTPVVTRGDGLSQIIRIYNRSLDKPNFKVFDIQIIRNLHDTYKI